MAVPLANDAISYIVYRDIAPGEPFDPTSPLLFFPPKGSDELFDALRIAFPNVKTHSERMRDAIIKYLLEERQDEQLQLPQPSPAMTLNDIPAAWPTLTPETSLSSGSNSMFSSPDLLNFETPASFTHSPQPQAPPQAPQMTRQASVTTSTDQSPPSLDQMTGVFSLSTSAQPKQRIRRKMTEAEKVEYRKRRIVKACGKCAARKRKCPHNQAEMETVPASSKNTARISKSTSPKSSITSSKSTTPPTAQQQPPFDASMLSVDDLDFGEFGNAFIPSQDFTMFEDPLADLDMNTFAFDNFTRGNDFFTPDVSPLQQTWSFEGQPGDSTILDGLPSNMHHTQQNILQPGGQQEDRQYPRVETFATDHNLQAWEGHFMQEGPSRRRNGTYVNQSLQQQVVESGIPEQPVPTHARHVHDAANASMTAAEQNATLSRETQQQVSLPRTVLRLTGTKKALGALARPLERSSLASIGKGADAVKSGNAFVHAPPGEDGLQSRVPQNASRPVDSQQPVIDRYLLSDQMDSRPPRLPESLEGISGSRRSRAHAELNPTSTSVSASQGSLQAQRSTVLEEGRPSSSTPTTPAGKLLTNVPSSSSGDQGQTKTQLQRQRRRPEPSLGEGLPEHINPSYELYMARKRISSSLTSVVGRNMNIHLLRLATEFEVGVSSTGGLSSTLNANGGAYPRRTARESIPALCCGGLSVEAGNDQDVSASPDLHGLASQATEPENYAFRPKRDTFRQKDHFGRTGLENATVCGLFVLLAAAALFASSSASPFWIAFAFASALSFESADGKQKAVQCTTKNSWWLSSTSTLASKFLGKASKAKTMHGAKASFLPMGGSWLRV